MYFQQASGLNQEEVSAEETLDEPVELITPTSIQEVEAALKNLEAKQLVAKGNEYENIDDPNDKYARVSTRKGEFEGSNQRAANRGTIIDDMLRGFINGTATKIEDIRKIYIEHPLKDQTQPFNAEFIRELFAIFNEVKDIADNRGITLTAKVPTLWGTIDGKKYAGTIDLLGIDKSGQVFIIDLKTSSQERRSHYEMVQFLRDNAGDMFNSIMEKIKAEEKNNILNVKNFTAKEQKVIDQLVEKFKDKVNKNLNRLALYDYSGQDSSQQSGYAELLRQRTGITAKKITIFPIRVTVEDKVYTKAEAEKNGDGKFTMDVEIDRATFPETPKVKPKAKVETQESQKADIEIIRSKLGHENNKKMFDEFINLVQESLNRTGFNGLTAQELEILLKGLDNNSVAIVGGVTSSTRNNIEREDLDTAWIEAPVNLTPAEAYEYQKALVKLKEYLSSMSTRQQPQSTDKIEKDRFTVGGSEPIFIGDIIKNLVNNRYTELAALEGAVSDIEAKKADTERKTTKVISSETVEKGDRKGQTRTVTQTNSIEDLEGTVLSVTEYDAKVGDTEVTLGGRIMTFKEFKEEFPLEEDWAEILEGFEDLNDDTKITVRKVRRTPTSSRFGSVVDIFNPTLGKMTVEIKKDDTKYNAELAALKGAEKAPVVEKAKPTVEGKVLGQKPTSPKISEVVGKTVYYNGKPYMVQKEGVRYILNSETTIIELAGDKDSTLESLGIDYFKGEFYKPEYDITVNSENSVTVNGVSYIVKSDAKGNVIGLSPLNKPEQVIKNEKLLIAVEIERNKTTFVNTNTVLDEVDTEEILDQIEETDPATHQKLMNVERVYNMNWNETVEAGLSNLYSKKPLTESQRLAVDLWVTDAIINMTSVYNRTSDPIYANALDNLEIINTLLYEGYTEKPKKAGTDESTKRTVKQTSTEAERKPGKTVSEEPTVILDSKALNKLGFTDLMLENMTEQELMEASRFTTPEEASEFREAIIDKQRALDIYHPYITEFTLYKDAQLVANQTLLRKDETGEYVIFADIDDIVVVKSFDKKTGDVTLQKLGSNVTLVADISELDPVLIFKEQVMTEPEKAEETITNKKEAATFTEEGNTLLTNFLDSKTRQSEIEKGVESPEVTNDDLDDNLLNDLKC